MRNSLTIMAALTLLLFLPSIAAAAGLVFDAPTHEFGTIIQGTTLTHSFTFRNTEKNTVTISRVGSSCGCTVANVSHRILLPGKGGQLTTSFDSSDFSGPVTKEIYVYTDNAEKPTYTLLMRGTIAEEFVSTPGRLNLGSVKPGNKVVTTLKLTNRGKVPVTIKGATSTLPQTTVALGRNVLKPGESTELTLTIVPKSTGRFINGYLNISLAGLGRKEKSIPVFGVIQK